MSKKDKMIIIWGTGLEAEVFLYSNLEIFDRIDCFIGGRNNKDSFHRKRVLKLSDIENIKEFYYIVCAGQYSTFSEIKKELESLGLKEFEHFIWNKFYKKRKVVINAHCHGRSLENYLRNSVQFCMQYEIYPWTEIEYGVKYDENVIRNADVFIHQDIRTDNQVGYEYSDDYIRRLLRPGCVDITIPNSVGMGKFLYPMLGELSFVEGMQGERFWILYRDFILDEASEKPTLTTLKDIREYWEEYSFKSETLEQLFQESMSKLRKRETNWDFNVAGFIEKSFRRIPCFVDGNHFSKYLWRNVCKEVSDKLGLSDIDDDQYPNNMGIPIPIHPAIVDHFGIDYSVETEKIESYLGKKVNNELDDYIKAYMWWFHNMIL